MEAASRGERWSFRAMTQKPRLAGRSVFRAHVRAFPEVGAGFKDGGLSKVPAFPLGKWPDGLFRRNPNFIFLTDSTPKESPSPVLKFTQKGKHETHEVILKFLRAFHAFCEIRAWGPAYYCRKSFCRLSFRRAIYRTSRS